MTGILDLPLELFEKVLLEAVISRGVQRALRLRLVCKLFNSNLQPTLFESRLLDDFETHSKRGSELLGLLSFWQVRRTYRADKFWHDYLLYRVKRETDLKIGRFVEIRQIAESICQHTDSEMDKTLDALCWLAIEAESCAPGHRRIWGCNDQLIKANPGLNLLSAAAYLGHISLAKRLLSEGQCPTRDNFLFDTPIQQAAFTGNIDMLKLFQEHLPEFEIISPLDSREYLDWRAQISPGSIKGAVMNGDMDIIRTVIYPPSRAEPGSKDFAGQPFGELDSKVPNKRVWELYLALDYVKTWELYQYIDAFFSKPALSDGFGSALLLARHTGAANVEMVRCLLDAGADIDGIIARNNCNPLTIAARCGHEDIVDLLLERGAKPGWLGKQQNGCPLFGAASSGSLPIYQKLIDHGAFEADICWSTLIVAIRLEHTAMVQFIVGLREWSGRERDSAAKSATNLGLESMALLVREIM